MINVTENGIDLLAHFLSKIKTQWNDVDIIISPAGLTLCSLSVSNTSSLLCRIHDGNFENLPSEEIKTRVDTKYLDSIFKKAKQFETISIDPSKSNIGFTLINDELKVRTSLPLIFIDEPHPILSVDKLYKEPHFVVQMELDSLRDVLSMLDGYVMDDCFTIEKIADQAILSASIDTTSNTIEIPTTFLQGFVDVKPTDIDGELYLNHKVFKQHINLIKDDDEVKFVVLPGAVMFIHQVTDDYELALGIGGSKKPDYSDSTDTDDLDWGQDDEHDWDDE